jgi:hypothetical protein
MFNVFWPYHKLFSPPVPSEFYLKGELSCHTGEGGNNFNYNRFQNKHKTA